jgi:hypothetical protein
MADSKLTALTEITNPATTDDVYIVSTPGGTPASKRCTIANFKTAIGITQGCRVYNSGNLTITTATLTALTFNSERYDTDGIHDTGSNTGRLTCQTAGKYHIFGHIQWAVDATGVRIIAIRLGGTTYLAISSQMTIATNVLDSACYQSIDTVYDLAASNYVELVVGHTKGSNLDIAAAGNFSPEFGMERIG